MARHAQNATYRGRVFRLGRESRPLTRLRAVVAGLLFSVAAASAGLDARPTGVAFPSGATVPENLLRIEMRFSEPLRRSLSLDHVKLIDSNGLEITHAFFDLPLLSADGRRVTVLLDPGRIKSGLAENRALGRALHAGSAVTLEVDDPELARPIRKTWRVTGFNADPPRPDLWTFRLPRRDTKDPLEVRLGAPLSSTAESFIAIRGPDARRVAGTAHLEQGETVWRFVPASSWRKGVYGLVTRPELEDSAGNRPCGPFEAMGASRIPCAAAAIRNFQPRAPSDPRITGHI